MMDRNRAKFKISSISSGYSNFVSLEKRIVFMMIDLVVDNFLFFIFLIQIPMILGALGIWYSNFYGSQSYTILPYDQVMVFIGVDSDIEGKSD